MIQILYTHDHAARGTALSTVVPGSRHGLINTTTPSKVPNLDTLVFWGHGDAWKLCGQDPDGLVRIIKDWKRHNSGIKTVELITCNARHYTVGTADAFANRVKAGLRRGFRSSTHKVKVKALPTTVTGSHNAFSILLAEPGTRSWVYVTGPGTDDSVMQEGAKLIQYEQVGTRSVSFKGDIAARADKVLREHKKRQWTMNYGYFNTLRDCLVKV